MRGNDSTKEMKEQMTQWTAKQQAAQLTKEAAKQQALGIASVADLLEDVSEGERAPGSPTKSVDSEGRSSAGGKLLDPSNVGVSTRDKLPSTRLTGSREI